MLNPRFSTCSKCGLPWNYCKEKAVYYTPTSGTFATCKYCWDNSTLEELKKYYSETYFSQGKGSTEPRDHSLYTLLKAVEKEYLKQSHTVPQR